MMAGASSNFGVTATDNNAALSFYVFSTNNTGVWVNDTATAFTSNPQTVSVTKTLSSTIGQVIGYRWYVNDTYNNWVDSGIQTLTTAGYTITVNSAYGNPTSSGTVAQGDSYAASVTSPFSGGTNIQYVCTGYSIDGGSSTAGTSYAFTDVQASHTITFYWQTQYQIIPSADSNSVINPSSAVWVNAGSSQTFTYSANTGYRVNSVLVDGSSVSIIGSYTFSDVTASSTISVFSKINPTPTPSPSSLPSPTPSLSPSSSPAETPSPAQQSDLNVIILAVAVILVLAVAVVIFRRKISFKGLKQRL
jgi:hypothetical protein